MKFGPYKSGLGQGVMEYWSDGFKRMIHIFLAPPDAHAFSRRLVGFITQYSNPAVVANPADVAKATLAESAATLAESATPSLHVEITNLGGRK